MKYLILMKSKFTLILLLTTLILSSQLKAIVKPSQEWIDQKFSMFIHFGLYSVYGGVYEGEPVVKGYSEQIQSFAGIFSDWYANTANEFNPTKWNPDSVVALAKAAGMRSIVFTSKHHDGFCMYHSDYTSFNIVDSTPYGRDLMKELAEACKRGGIRFGVYFSLIDWHYPHAYPISSHNADPLTDEHYEYNLKQVEEIMTNYGDISEIWFDMGSLTPKQSKGLYELVDRLQPGCMISGRLGNDFVDFAVMADNEYPDYKMGVPWQTAASMFDETWSYRSWQERGEVKVKVEEKIASLVEVISRGGNYLLNIGPRGDGSIVEFERDVLLGIGDWIDKNSEAIYGAEANPFHNTLNWGDVTTNNGNLYAFVKNVPSSSKIDLSGFTGDVKSVELLPTGKSFNFEQKGDRLEIDINAYGDVAILATMNMPVIKISFVNNYTIKPALIVKDGVLSPLNANPLFGHSSLNYYAGYKSLIGYNWTFKTRKSKITPVVSFTESEIGRRLTFDIDGQRQSVTLQPASSKKVTIPRNSVKWTNLYRKAGRGVFGNLSEEGNLIVDTSEWQKVSNFDYYKTHKENILPRQSIVFLQEIESDHKQTVAVRIGSGNGAYIILNGEYITAHLLPDRLKSQDEIVLLPLKKGLNQLVIKYYNGFEKELSYSITPLYEWIIYQHKLASKKLEKEEYHSLSLTSEDAESNVSPLRMNNIVIEF